MIEVRFKRRIDCGVFVMASKNFMEKVSRMKKYKLTYIEGNCIRTIVLEGENSNSVLIKFLIENKQVTDVTKIEEVQ